MPVARPPRAARGRSGPAPPRAPARPFAVPVAAPAAVPRPVGAQRLPWPVWLGVGLVALGLPLGGGLVVLRGRRRSARGACVRAGERRERPRLTQTCDTARDVAPDYGRGLPDSEDRMLSMRTKRNDGSVQPRRHGAPRAAPARARRGTSPSMIVALTALVLAAAGGAMAAIPDTPGGLIHVCYDTSDAVRDEGGADLGIIDKLRNTETATTTRPS